MFTFIYRKPSDCIISSDQIITSDFVRFVLFSSIQLISSDHLISSITSVHLNFVRPYYFRLSYLPVQFSSSYFALFLYLNTNLIQIKSRTRTFPETATRSLRPRRIYCNTPNLLLNRFYLMRQKLFVGLCNYNCYDTCRKKLRQFTFQQTNKKMSFTKQFFKA